MSIVSQIIVWAFAVVMICLAVVAVITLAACIKYVIEELRGDKYD